MADRTGVGEARAAGREPGELAPKRATKCSGCNRTVLIGEKLAEYFDPRTNKSQDLCDLCRANASSRGLQSVGAPEINRGYGKRLRVEQLQASELAEPEPVRELSRPQRAILERMRGESDEYGAPSPAILERLRAQDLELSRLRDELDPVRRAQEQRLLQEQKAELTRLKERVGQLEYQLEREKFARHAETSQMRMSGFALEAFNQSNELDRMARIARTLGEPTINVHDEGPGIPRRVRLTMTWEIAWYEFVVKLDLAAGRASVHETGQGGDIESVPRERRRANAHWRDSGIVL